VKTSKSVDPSNISSPAVLPGHGPDGVPQSTTSLMAGMPSIKSRRPLVAIGRYERNTLSMRCGGTPVLSVLTATFTSPPNQFSVEASGGGCPRSVVKVVEVVVVVIVGGVVAVAAGG
jgi:hypothetical protein